MADLCRYADPVFDIVACTVGTAPPHLWTCPGCSRNWCHHHQEGPGAMCGSCMMRIGGSVPKSLVLSPDLALPAEEFVERALALIAKRGRGKTGGVKVIEEALLKLGLPFVVFDPVGVHWGLRSSFDGKKPSGFEVLVIGGAHGDLPLDRKAGRAVARSIADNNVSLIIDFKGVPHAAYREFVADFCDELLNINGLPRLLIFEEAPRLLPQRLRPDQTACYDAVLRTILEGRNAGLWAGPSRIPHPAQRKHRTPVPYRN